MTKPKLLIFASGSKTGGGSGFQELVLNTRSGVLNADIVGVVSNHANGGVKEKADAHGITFIHLPNPIKAEDYLSIAKETGAEWFALSGWFKFVYGLDPTRTFNIHPGLLMDLVVKDITVITFMKRCIKLLLKGKLKELP